MIGITLVLLVILNYGCNYAYAVTKIARAKEQGVYPTVEDVAMRNLGKEFRGSQVVSITGLNCSPNYPHGKLPFIWFCIARVKMDQIPEGLDRSEWSAGNFYIHVREGWVFMSEGSFPGFIGRVMERHNLEGVNEWSAEN